MAMPCSVRDREQAKFKETAGGDTSLRVCVDTSGGSIPVEITDGSFGTKINVFDETTIGTATTSTIVTYTVPADKQLCLQLVEYSGENIAKYFVEIDGAKEAQKRTYFGADLSGQFEFNKLKVDENLVVRLRVENFRPTSADFDGRILGELNDK